MYGHIAVFVCHRINLTHSFRIYARMHGETDAEVGGCKGLWFTIIMMGVSFMWINKARPIVWTPFGAACMQLHVRTGCSSSSLYGAYACTSCLCVEQTHDNVPHVTQFKRR